MAPHALLRVPCYAEGKEIVLELDPTANGIPAAWRWVVNHSVARRANAPRGIWAIKATSLVGIVFRASRCCWFAAAVGLVFSRKQEAGCCRFY
jgi:hypothetical protein